MARIGPQRRGGGGEGGGEEEEEKYFSVTMSDFDEYADLIILTGNYRDHA